MRIALVLALAGLVAAPAVAARTGTPSRLDGAVVYGVVPRLYGADGAARVTEHLDELRDLGVDVLWLSPITRTTPGDFGYATVDYQALRDDFGDERSFHRLVEEAHRRGLKVLMDLAVNHTSDRHPHFLDAERRGRASPYWDYYDRDPSLKPTHYFDWRNLPNLNYANAEVRQMVAAAMTHWVRDFHVDGFRLDAAWGVRDRAPSFWPQLIRQLRSIDPNLIFIAEASARDPYYAQAGFDCAYDWAGPLGHAAWQEAFDDPAQVAARLRALVADPAGARALRFLDNNDTGKRFVERHGPALTRVATTMLLTLPGVPLIYAGEEVGAAYLPYDENAAKTIDWRDRDQLRPLHRRLIALRHRYAALRSNRLTLVPTSADDRVLAYARHGDDGTVALVLLDFADGAATRLRLPAELPDGDWLDLLSGDRMRLSHDGDATVPMPTASARILVPAPAPR